MGTPPISQASIDHSWEDWYASEGDPFQGLDAKNDTTGMKHLLRHGVDIGQAIKTGALWWRVNGSDYDFNNGQC